jgi:[protein-PII] uridylyltransferase
MMTTTLSTRPIICEARESVAAGRARLKELHRQGASGNSICSHMSDLMDTVLLEVIHNIYDEVTDGDRQSLEKRIALVPHGGYGRRDVAPYSDVDLMLLYRPDSLDVARQIADRLNKDIVDIGFALGFSARTQRDAWQLASKEAEVFTSLCEARYLSGSVGLFSKFMSQLAKQSHRNVRLLRAVEEKRQAERSKYGASAYLLRPDIKRSAGTLRDIQFIRWLGYIRYGETDLNRIYRAGGLHESDSRNLMAAREFLLRLRNELHFHAGKSHNQLGRNEQLRIADLLKYEGREEKLPVEFFMRDYFQHSSQVAYAVEHFLASCKSRFQMGNLFEPLFSRSLEGIYRIGPTHIGVTRKDLHKVKGSLVSVLHLMKLANLYNKRIDHPTWCAIRDSMRELTDIAVTPEAASHFVTMLSERNRLHSLIRRLHELGVLEKLIPGFKQARCLIQFNQYHKFTVDEHTLLALETAIGYATDTSTLGKVYRAIKHPERLHLAILLHDLGKGRSGDHSQIGGVLADETCTLLGMTPSDTKAVRFLVENHLVMADLAMRRDISDESVVAQFAADVGRPDYLQMLYLLTCADISSVGPGTMTKWKQNFLTELFHRAMYQLSGESFSDSATQTTEPIRQQIKGMAENLPEASWYFKQVDALPSHSIAEIDPDRLFALLQRMRTLPHGSLSVSFGYLPKQKACQFLIGKHDEAHSGVFHKLTGAISSAGLDILTAGISYLDDPMVLYRFVACDKDYADQPPDHRVKQVIERIEQSVLQSSPTPSFRKTWGQNPKTTRADELTRKPTRVRFDNDTAENMTIIDIFARDRVGLLYTITRKIYELGLQIRLSKVATLVDQVLDVFYVTEADGHKIVDDQRLEHIRAELIRAVDETE